MLFFVSFKLYDKKHPKELMYPVSDTLILFFDSAVCF